MMYLKVDRNIQRCGLHMQGVLRDIHCICGEYSKLWTIHAGEYSEIQTTYARSIQRYKLHMQVVFKDVNYTICREYSKM